MMIKHDETRLARAGCSANSSGSRRVTIWAIVGLLLPFMALALTTVVVDVPFVFQLWRNLEDSGIRIGLVYIFVFNLLLVASLIIGVTTLTRYRRSSRPQVVLGASSLNLIITIAILVIIYLPVQL